MTRAIDPIAILAEPTDDATESREVIAVSALILLAMNQADPMSRLVDGVVRQLVTATRGLAPDSQDPQASRNAGVAVRLLATATCSLASDGQDPQAAMLAVMELFGAWLHRGAGNENPIQASRTRDASMHVSSASSPDVRHGALGVKIDLDELERMAPKSHGCGPGTTLALIAHVRELRAALTVMLKRFEGELGSAGRGSAPEGERGSIDELGSAGRGSAPEGERGSDELGSAGRGSAPEGERGSIDELIAEYRAVLERGAVLP